MTSSAGADDGGTWISEPCRAKLNLFLDVRGRRPDGYHELCTVFHEIDLADRLLLRRADAPPGTPRARLTCVSAGDGPGSLAAPIGPQNLVVRAADALLREAGAQDAIELALEKHIPIGAGLGGGSADAAAALRGIDRLLGLGASSEDLVRIGAQIGSDVPFLVRGGTALGRGRGELLEPVPVAAPIRFALIVPPFGVSTPDVYRALARDLAPPVDESAVLAALATGDIEGLARAIHNALEPAAEAVAPDLRDLRVRASADWGSPVHVTGSGSTLFAVLHDDASPSTGAIDDAAVVLATSG